jgi:carbon-monoxide dehydrogenase medium subunit
MERALFPLRVPMKPASFRYHAPKTIEEALAMLAEYAPDDGRVLAGGQSLVPTMAFRLARPHHLVDINGIEALRRLGVEHGKLAIGAGVRHQAFQRPVTDGPLGRLLSAVMRHIAHYPIRTRGTFCGSVAHADPASEWCLVAATLGAEMVARSARGTRIVAAKDFFQGIMTTALEPDELLAEVRLPLLAADTRFGFYEFNRRAGDFAMGMALVTFRVADGIIVAPHVGVGGAETRPRRIPAAEALLAGRPPGEAVFRAAAEAASAAIDPLTDAQTDAEYRRDLVATVTRRALAQAAGP